MYKPPNNQRGWQVRSPFINYLRDPVHPRALRAAAQTWRLYHRLGVHGVATIVGVLRDARRVFEVFDDVTTTQGHVLPLYGAEPPN